MTEQKEIHGPMIAYEFWAHVFRRDQCRDLGWEWSCSLAASSLIEAKEKGAAEINNAMGRTLLPATRSNYKSVVKRSRTDEERDYIRLCALRLLNEPFMKERAKWPTLTEDCSDRAIALHKEWADKSVKEYQENVS